MASTSAPSIPGRLSLSRRRRHRRSVGVRCCESQRTRSSARTHRVNYLIDANLSPQVVVSLESAGHRASHVGDHGLLTATDDEIFDWAVETIRSSSPPIPTSPMLLAARRTTMPSVVLLRDVADKPPAVHATLLVANLTTVEPDLARGRSSRSARPDFVSALSPSSRGIRPEFDLRDSAVSAPKLCLRPICGWRIGGQQPSGRTPPLPIPATFLPGGVRAPGWLPRLQRRRNPATGGAGGRLSGLGARTGSVRSADVRR